MIEMSLFVSFLLTFKLRPTVYTYNFFKVSCAKKWLFLHIVAGDFSL